MRMWPSWGTFELWPRKANYRLTVNVGPQATTRSQATYNSWVDPKALVNIPKQIAREP
jgi:hypothetical protein